MSERKGRRMDQIPDGPRSDLGKFLYDHFLKNVVPQVIQTSRAIGEFGQERGPKVKKKLKGTVGRLSRICAEAAGGRLGDVNFATIPFPDPESADDFAAAISKENSEIYPIPSSITSKLHQPFESASDGIARQSRISGLTTIVTEVTAHNIGSTRRYYTVRIVGGKRLVDLESESNTKP